MRDHATHSKASFGSDCSVSGIIWLCARSYLRRSHEGLARWPDFKSASFGEHAMRSQQLANAETHFPLAQAAKAGTIHCRSFGIWPGLLLTGSISAFAFALRQIPGLSTFSPMIL